MTAVTNELIVEILRQLQAGQERLEDGQKSIRDELQTLGTQHLSMSHDIANIYARLGSLGERVDRIEHRLGLYDEGAPQ